MSRGLLEPSRRKENQPRLVTMMWSRSSIPKIRPASTSCLVTSRASLKPPRGVAVGEDHRGGPIGDGLGEHLPLGEAAGELKGGHDLTSLGLTDPGDRAETLHRPAGEIRPFPGSPWRGPGRFFLHRGADQKLHVGERLRPPLEELFPGPLKTRQVLDALTSHLLLASHNNSAAFRSVSLPGVSWKTCGIAGRPENLVPKLTIRETVPRIKGESGLESLPPSSSAHSRCGGHKPPVVGTS